VTVAPREVVRELIVVALDHDRVALPVADVREIQRAAMPAHLPNAPEIVDGVLNVRGELVPMLDVRSRLGHAKRALHATDHIVIAMASARVIAFAVDEVVELIEVSEQDIQEAVLLVTGTTHIAGIATLPGGLLVIHDLRALLASDEVFGITRALAAVAP
jgi:purine-binding chemotaxis protein CheW